jgi:hypothetical protein
MVIYTAKKEGNTMKTLIITEFLNRDELPPIIPIESKVQASREGLSAEVIAEFLNRDELPPIIPIESKVQASREGLSAEVIAEFLNRDELPPIFESKKDFIVTKPKTRTRNIQ